MSKIKQIQIGEDTYDLSVNAGDIDGAIGGTLLGDIGNFTSQANALDITNLEKGTYTISTEVNIPTHFYVKNTYDNNSYYYDLNFTSYSLPKGVLITMILPSDTRQNNNVIFCFASIDAVNKTIGNWETRLYVRNTGEIIFDVNYSNRIEQILSAIGEQTVYAKKTFNTLPESSVVPTTDNQLANKKYVDDAVAGTGGSNKIYYLDLTSLYYTVRDTNTSFNISDQTTLDILSSIRTDLSNGEQPIIYFKWKYEIVRFGSWMTAEVVAPAYYYDNYGTWIIQVDNNYHCGWGSVAIPSNYASLAIWTSNSSSSVKYTEYHSNYRYATIDEVPTNALTTDNTTSYTVTNDYNPAHKKYVDDTIASAITDALGGSY